MCVEEEFIDEQLPEEDELFVVYVINAIPYLSLKLFCAIED